jgi:uncharacterized protein
MGPPVVGGNAEQVPLIKWDASFGSWMAGFAGDLEQYHRELADDRRNRALGKEPRYIPFEFPEDDSDANSDNAEYMATWGEAERRNYKGRVTLQSYQPTVLIDMMPFMEMISPSPLLMLIADGDMLPWQREAFQAALEPKSLVELKGHHHSLYTTAKQEAIASARD